MNESLIQFVDHAREKGMDHATIRQLLLAAGWKEKDVAEVFCTRDLEMPIPKPTVVSPIRPRGRRESVWPRRARDAFLHLLMFGALYTCVTSLILLFVTYINFAFPDPAWRTSYAQMEELLSIIRAQLAIVIVSFPICLILWHFLLREVRRNPERVAIRRWLGYLSIFVGALTLSGDVMTLIYFMLEGQLTVRFLLKAAVLFLIAGSLVLYLAFTLRSETKTETEQ
jgi:ABC-type Fe3+ transport system permease subunit